MGAEALHIGLQAQAMLGYQFSRDFLLVGMGTRMVPGEFVKQTQAKQTNELWVLSIAAQWTF